LIKNTEETPATYATRTKNFFLRRRAPLLHGLLAHAQVRALRGRYNREKAEKVKRQPTNVSFSKLPRTFTTFSLTHVFTSLSRSYRCFFSSGASPCVRRPWLLTPCPADAGATSFGVGRYFAVKGLNFFRYFAGKGAKFRENFAEISKFR
jgi:hypothetical protein